MLRTLSMLCALTFLGGLNAQAQDSRRPLSHADYGQFADISNLSMSPQGHVSFWVTEAPEQDPELAIALPSGAMKRYPRGTDPQWIAPSTLVFIHKAPLDETRTAIEAGKKGLDRPADDAFVWQLAPADTVLRFSRVAGILSSDRGGALLVVKHRPDYLLPDSSDAPESSDPFPVSLHHTLADTTLIIMGATRASLSYDGRVAWVGQHREEDSTTTILRIEQTMAGFQSDTLFTGAGKLVDWSGSRNGMRFAFTIEQDGSEAEQESGQPPRSVWVARGSDKARSVAPPAWGHVSATGLSFSDDGERLWVALEEIRAARVLPDSIPKHEVVNVDIWHWQDATLQPAQLLGADNPKTYQAWINPETSRWTIPAPGFFEQILTGEHDDGRWALGVDEDRWVRQRSWRFPYRYDLYRIDLATGDTFALAKGTMDLPRVSPTGRFAYSWNRDDQQWEVFDLSTGSKTKMDAGIPTSLANEEHDWPYAPSAHGSPGWTTGDAHLLLYDAFDVWQVDPQQPNAPQRLTRGREEGLVYRLIDVDADRQAHDPADLWFRVQDDADKTMSVARMNPRRGRVTPVYRSSGMLSSIRRARSGEAWQFRYERFDTFPDVWLADRDFDAVTQLSQLDTARAPFLWGSSQLVSWTNVSGATIDGVLYLPEAHYDGTIPMMVYFYERFSDNLHRHWRPEPYRSIINPTFYVSRGYAVFIPDIPYEVGFPGESAMDAVMTGISNVLDHHPRIDRNRVGVQGHSWGGYQIAYMVTRTNFFKAAEAGAPVSNMTSAYGGIRYGSGMSRMFQYENTQSRIGGSLWERPLEYLENSPIFQADRITTPLLMMHNDEDGAVPWTQGIELFVALRRLDRPVWLINYNGEPHNLTKWANKVDWATRMQQFFDHYLQGAPAPVWLREGVPAREKGRTLGLEIAQ